MKRYLMLLSIVFLLLALPEKANAAGLCENKTLSDYRSLAGNINITYDYRMVDGRMALLDGQPIFDVTISNIYDDIYIVDTSTNKTYTYKSFSSETELIIKGYKDNQKIKYQIYTSATGCYGQLLTTRYVTFPNYNEYSADEICKGAEEYSMCQRWGAVSGTYEEFVAKVTTYKENKNKPIPEEKIPSQFATFMEKVFKFIGDYYIFLVAGVVIIILVVAAIRNISVRKNQFDFKV
jgi:hypothetical protein